ncbi:multidrug efflux SMR transporter [Halobacillus sp. Marseille-Q1614]|uniref:DMT family transporter n=1 Tax=Halobacillus sp. Marseille-Q1614 TaxID=2709134 RepID=UPI001570F1F8|nr:SMR family transporter [Halobacillus sp. Marseille-Q1614]
MSWIFLIAAGLFEMSGVLMINVFHNRRTFLTASGLAASFSLSFLFLSLAMENIAMGTAYAVWTGIGAAGGALLGMAFFNEPKEWRRVVCIFMIIAAAVGLKIIE